MLFYFSGTGNSRHIAEKVAQQLHEQAVDMARTTQCEYTLADGERIGWIFPVYAWGPPPFVLAFIRRLKLHVSSAPYTYFICTCGDDIGRADRILVRELAKKGLVPAIGYSLQMPNTYVCLPGFDVDDDALVRRKLQHAATRLPSIIEAIRQRLHQAYDVYPGAYPWFKSCILRPLFNRFLVTDRFFRTTEACTGCGACAAACPVGNIRLQSDGPRWKGSCTGCLACYHRCPTRAVRFGRTTEHKGQYLYSRTE